MTLLVWIGTWMRIILKCMPDMGMICAFVMLSIAVNSELAVDSELLAYLFLLIGITDASGLFFLDTMDSICIMIIELILNSTTKQSHHYTHVATCIHHSTC
ncbi:hypothetical protein ACJX0J_030283, partial [Zea mays]